MREACSALDPQLANNRGAGAPVLMVLRQLRVFNRFVFAPKVIFEYSYMSRARMVARTVHCRTVQGQCMQAEKMGHLAKKKEERYRSCPICSARAGLYTE